MSTCFLLYCFMYYQKANWPSYLLAETYPRKSTRGSRRLKGAEDTLMEAYKGRR